MSKLDCNIIWCFFEVCVCGVGEELREVFSAPSGVMSNILVPLSSHSWKYNFYIYLKVGEKNLSAMNW